MLQAAEERLKARADHAPQFAAAGCTLKGAAERPAVPALHAPPSAKAGGISRVGSTRPPGLVSSDIAGIS